MGTFYTIELSEKTTELIKEHFQFKNDAEVEKQLQYWIDLDIAEVVLKEIIETIEDKIKKEVKE